MPTRTLSSTLRPSPGQPVSWEAGYLSTAITCSALFNTWQRQTAPAAVEAIFAISDGAGMIQGKLIEPAGWAFTSGDVATCQFRCASTSFDVTDPVFHLGVLTKVQRFKPDRITVRRRADPNSLPQWLLRYRCSASGLGPADDVCGLPRSCPYGGEKVDIEATN